MKLEHLIDGYKHKGLDAEISMKNEKEKAGVIKFTDDIYATYYSDEEIIKSIQVFASAITTKDKTASNQVQHTIKLIKVLSYTIDLLTNTTNKERNIILETLGLFNGTFKEGKQVLHNHYGYRVEIVDGLILFTISEVEDND